MPYVCEVRIEKTDVWQPEFRVEGWEDRRFLEPVYDLWKVLG